MTRTKQEQDQVDRFLASLEGELPDLDLEVEGIVDRILWLAKRLRRSLDETLGEFGLNHGEWTLLISLRRGGPPYRRSPGQLAKWADLSSGAMTNRLDRLEEAGLIRRLPDPDDRRALHVELTKKGHEVYERAIGVQAGKEARVASALTARERTQLNNMLRRLMLEYERDDDGRDAKE